jgi:PAS domain S-box-containing protein
MTWSDSHPGAVPPDFDLIVEKEMRVLMIEDSNSDRELIERELHRARLRFTSRQAKSGEEVRREIEEFKPDLVISDFTMPGFDGMSALRMIRERSPHTPFIFVSGTIGEERAAEALKQGATDYVLKSHMSRLVGVVRRAIFEVTERTERRRVEEALRVSEERYRMVALATNDLIWDWDLSTDVLTLSEAIVTVFGYADAGHVSRNWWMSRVHPDDRPIVDASLAAAVRNGDDVWTGEYRFRRVDGSFASIVDRGRIIRESSGTPVRIIGAVVDLSERKHLEEQLLHSQRLEAVGQLAGGVAHDFNNLLGVIIGHVDLAQELIPEDSAAIEDLHEIRQACRRASSLTRQLLAFARRQIVEPRAFDVNELIKDMERMIHRIIGEDIQLETRLSPVPVVVKADPGQIEQVLLNLVVNARDAMPEGGRLEIETRRAVRLDASDNHKDVPVGEWWVLAVRDSGTGIPPAVKQRLFEPFFTTKPVGRGTGLGLATCHGIVRQSGGHIRLDSELGQGTLFEVYLPPVNEPIQVRWDLNHRVETHRGTGTILLVEDEERLRRVEIELLSRMGYTVFAAANATEAREVLESQGAAIQLLITDVVLPGQRGTEIARRAQEQNPGLKIIYVSGYADVPLPEGGEANYLQKPFSAASLAEKVRQLLEG